jgi:hypothetical protein
MERKEELEQFVSCWEVLEDPRSGNATLHDFHELLMIVLCCVLCGGQGPTDMALFARAKETFLRGFLVLENGLPSHDTFTGSLQRWPHVHRGWLWRRSGPKPRWPHVQLVPQILLVPTLNHAGIPR